MNRIYGMTAGIALLSMSAAAQDTQVDKLKVELQRMVETSKIVSAGGGVMGRSVKGAPYSAQEVNENTQVLGDGTRIHNESRAAVYRDSEGRVRRETGDHVTIWDPMANVNITLDTKNMTAVKSKMGPAVFTRTFPVPAPAAFAGTAVGGFGGSIGAGPGTAGARVSVKDGVVTVNRDGKVETFPVGPDGSWVSEDGKIKAFSRTTSSTEGSKGETSGFTYAEGNASVVAFPPDAHMIMADKMKVEAMAAGGGRGGAMARMVPNFKTDALGEQVMEGVKVRGVKQTSTIEPGTIGNDRAINNISERWTSDDLQTDVLTRRSDPRSGEQVFRLININRAEPAAYLFQVPNGYSLTDRSK